MSKTKREKLEDLDMAVLDAMSELMVKKDYEELSNLSGVITYLKNNQVITPPDKEKGMHDKVKDAINSN